VVKIAEEVKTKMKTRNENSYSKKTDKVIPRLVANILTRAIEYAQVTKMLGNGRLEAQCFDGEKRLAHIRGKLRKKVWINQGDIILVSLRDFQDAKGDVILKYTADEARNLKAYGELPETAKINETDTFPADGDEEISFDFDIEEVYCPHVNVTNCLDLIMGCVYCTH
jgi:translation initiation factor 1A